MDRSAQLARRARSVAAAVHRHRALVFGLVARAVFWGALVLWCTTAITLVGGGPLELDAMLARFLFGAAACATITVATGVARLRWMTAFVGALHGIGGLGLWLLV